MHLPDPTHHPIFDTSIQSFTRYAHLFFPFPALDRSFFFLGSLSRCIVSIEMLKISSFDAGLLYILLLYTIQLVPGPDIHALSNEVVNGWKGLV